MFEDFIQSGEDWMQSSLLISMTKSSSQRRKGRHVLMPYADVKKKFGPAIAGQIFTDKRALEASKAPGDATVFFMPHPEAPTQEDIWLQNHFHFVYFVSPKVCLIWIPSALKVL